MVGVALIAGLTACGDKDSHDSGQRESTDGEGGSAVKQALSALQTASKRTGDEHSARVEGTTDMAGMKQVMRGDMDWSDGMLANMTIKQSGGALKDSPLDGVSMPARYTKDAMFVNLGDEFAASSESGGKHWMKYDYDAFAEQAGGSGAFLKEQMRSGDPVRSVQMMVASGAVKAVGTEDVRGTKATHYTGEVNVSDLARKQSDSLTEKDLKDLKQQLSSNGIETETVDVWIDAKDLLVKKREKAATKNGDYSSTVYYSDYGKAVDVTAPPASDTLDFQESLNQAS